MENIQKITGKKLKFYEMNMSDKGGLDRVFTENKVDAVIDFAAYKAVGESVQKPIEYYSNNVATVLVLLEKMKAYQIKTFIFSSSATVYGNPKVVPITEESPIGETTNPYGTSKFMVEKILEDLYRSDPTWNISILRYFNPIGAHKSGLLGEEPNGIPANLMPYMTKVASGQLKELSVFGNDYSTKDGTGVRDYIHVVDVAIGHVKALQKLEKEKKGFFVYNLGTGTGYSVLEMIHTFEKVNQIKIPYQFVPRRSGDLAAYFADTSKAEKELEFIATKSLEDMCKDAWNYEKNQSKKNV